MNEPIPSLRASLVARHTSEPNTPDENIPRIVREAARSTGVDYEFLMAKAQLESGLDATAKAPTSSAAGLFQFIEGTWLASFDRYGKEFGISAQQRTGAGKNALAPTHLGPEPPSRDEILDLRYDPRIAALMAAASARDNAAK